MNATIMNWVGTRQSAANSCFFAARSVSEQLYFPILDTLRLLQSQQPMSNHKEIRQSTRHEQPIGILREAAVAHLGESEHAFEHADGMLDARPHARACAVDDALARREVLVATTALLREAARAAWCCRADWRRWPPPSE